MGMYDKVSDILYCPFCGKQKGVNSFQTKDFDCILESRSLAEYATEGKHFKIYSFCMYCGKRISLNISPL